MKTAISIGDTRAVVLLSWLGVAVKIDEDLLSWALRNVGGNKSSVVTHLLLSIDSIHQCRQCRHCIPPPVVSKMDGYKIHQELISAKNEGHFRGIQELVNLAQTIVESSALHWFLYNRERR
jgi:hypothetical protein